MASGEIPGTIWNLEEMFALASLTSAWTAALFQCYLGAPSAKPTRIISTLPFCEPSVGPPLSKGWPRFSVSGSYLGPLPRRCSHPGKHTGLIGRPSDDGQFRTSAAAAYPPKMCQWIANMIVTFCRDRPKGGTFPVSTCNATVPPRLEPPPTAASPDCLDPADTSPLDVLLAPSTEVEAGAEGGDETSEEEEPGIPKQRLRGNEGGWGGVFQTKWAGKTKDFHDGGGLCSPGRYHPLRRRQYAWKGLIRLKLELKKLLAAHIPDHQALVLQMACGKLEESPFPDLLLLDAREAWFSQIESASKFPPEEIRGVTANQPFYLCALGESLRLLQDPDWRVLYSSTRECFAKGVSVGVGVRMPRTPAVYERKSKWRKLDETAFLADTTNYLSATLPGMEDVLQRQFEEESKLGMMYETSLSEAQAQFPGDKLRIAPQGAIEKGDDTFRILHDGTHFVRVNNDTVVRDQLRMPTAGDARKVMEVCSSERPGAHFAILADVKKAHRRFLHRMEDWGLLACRSGPDQSRVWINRVGTFGIGTASYWWSRIAACLHRFAAAFFVGDWIFAFLFADDLRVQTHGPEKYSLILLYLLIWSMAGTPFSHKKYRGGLEVEWIGYFLDYGRFELGITESRALWLLAWGDRILKERIVMVSALAEGLGRLGFASGLLEWSRPFLSAMYAWTASAPGHATLPVPPMILLTLTWLMNQLRSGRRTCSGRAPSASLGEIFRTDAKGEADYVVIGGWESRGNTKPSEARWFSLRIPAEDAQWLFERGHGSRTIASSELLGTLVALHLFVPKVDPGTTSSGSFTCSGLTDNQGNAYVVQKLLTTKYPLAAVLMQLSSELAARNLWLDLQWTPRENNKEADALTNEQFDGFDMTKRMHVELCDLPTDVMADLLLQGRTFLLDIEHRKEELKNSGNTRHRKRKRQGKTPWGV